MEEQEIVQGQGTELESAAQPEQPDQQEPQEQDSTPELSDGNEIGVNEDGELTISDSFFNDES